MSEDTDVTETTDRQPNRPWYLRPVNIVIGVVLALALVIGGGLFLVDNSVTNEGNTKEAALNSQYVDNQNYLSDCITRIRESAGVARGQTAALDQVLTDAVKGRYDQGSSAEVGRGQLFSAMVEAYPDLSSIGNAFDRVMTVVNGCRTDYRGQQSRLLDMLRSYDTWRTGSWTIRTFGDEFPSNNLAARIGANTTRGQAALDQMYTIVLVREAKDAYESGELTPEDPFGTTPAPSPTR